MKFANVIVDISLQKLDKTFSYIVPEEIEDKIFPGAPVRVPFGNRELAGFVLSLSDKTDIEKDKLKEIICIEEKSVAIESELIRLASFISKRYGCTMNQSLRAVLPSKRKVASKKVRVEQTPIIETKQKDIKLNDEQVNIINSINNNYTKPVLIHGITGSGKTEIYMELIDKMISEGKQTILLIPEISLTFQNLQRFHARYSDRVGVVNSRLSAGEKYDIFDKAREGKIDVIIGPRSAVFTPFANLGLIIIDEAHSASYFSEMTPRYKTTEVAIERARIANAKVVLGSATPLISDYKKALSGEYDLYKLTKRAVEGSELPQVSIVDLKEELKAGNRTIFSRELASDISDRLEKKQQVMLFLNRRGYAGFVSCRSCGFVAKCPHCDISMTLHYNGKLVCHYCGHEELMPIKCPTCGSKYIGKFGLGTEKVEEAVKKYFPDARVLRMDADTTSGKAGHSKILSKFASGGADILIGTQMIVKGHDFPNVTLVGVIAADLSLYSNDFMAGERTFELLTQAAGRAGRGDEPGKVIIQTYNPDNIAITASASQNYEAFYNEEISFRSMLGYPPEGAMLSLLLINDKKSELIKEASDLTNDIATKYIDNKIRIIGSNETGIKKLEDKFHLCFYVKHSSEKLLLEMRDYILEKEMASSVTMDVM